MVLLLRQHLRRYVQRHHDLVVKCWLYFPDARRRDPDAPLKLLLDTVALALGIDDRWLLPQVMGRTIDRAWPRIELRLEVL